MPPKKKQEDVKPDEIPVETPAEPGDQTPESAPGAGPEVADDPAEPVEVREPCRACYPDGWPAPAVGASASCHHGIAVTYGRPTFVTRDIAEAAGLV